MVNKAVKSKVLARLKKKRIDLEFEAKNAKPRITTKELADKLGKGEQFVKATLGRFDPTDYVLLGLSYIASGYAAKARVLGSVARELLKIRVAEEKIAILNARYRAALAVIPSELESARERVEEGVGRINDPIVQAEHDLNKSKDEINQGYE